MLLVCHCQRFDIVSLGVSDNLLTFSMFRILSASDGLKQHKNIYLLY